MEVPENNRIERLEAILSEAADILASLKLDLASLRDPVKESVTFSAPVRINRLGDKILALLRERGEPMSSAEIAEALYHPTMPVSPDALKRRVIVAVSDLHKSNRGIVKYFSQGAEMQWGLVAWDAARTVSAQTGEGFRLNTPTLPSGFDEVRRSYLESMQAHFKKQETTQKTKAVQ